MATSKFLESFCSISHKIFGDVSFGCDAYVGKGMEPFIVLKTGTIVAEKHFSWSYFSSEQIGRKALEVVLSDVVVMGGTAQYALCTLAFPSTSKDKDVLAVFEGVCLAAKDHGIKVVGGDTVETVRDFMVGITLIGFSKEIVTKTIKTFRSGDKLYSIGSLGKSHAGLQVLQRAPEQKKHFPSCISAHLEPKAMVAEAKWLQGCDFVMAMTDNSDGLRAEIATIKRLNKLSIDLNLDHISLEKEVEAIASLLHEDPMRYVLEGGEDFGILVGVNLEKISEFEQGFRAFFETPLIILGELV